MIELLAEISKRYTLDLFRFSISGEVSKEQFKRKLSENIKNLSNIHLTLK